MLLQQNKKPKKYSLITCKQYERTITTITSYYIWRGGGVDLSHDIQRCGRGFESK